MINFLSTWSEQIVLAVIVATIIELILPNNKNKKYIQMVIGIYVLFNIISPIVSNKEVFSLDNYEIENNTTDSEYIVDQSSMDKRLEKIYLEELEKIVTTKFEQAGFSISKCEIDAVLDTNQKNAGIHSITVKIKGPADENILNETKKQISKEYEIDEDKIIIKIS